MQIAVIDLGMGNLRSVEQALVEVSSEVDVIVTDEARVINDADKLVLPGQGAIGSWFQALQDRHLDNVLPVTLREKPVLGICVGMQALFDYCDESGGVPGLGLFQGSVRHFSEYHDKTGPTYKIPHMGWNQVAQIHAHPLWHKIEDQSYFYFVHSYCANAAEDADLGLIYGTADYGHQFIAAIGKGNVFAVQFHPEKSHRDGLQLLQNFVTWNGAA